MHAPAWHPGVTVQRAVLLSLRRTLRSLAVRVRGLRPSPGEQRALRLTAAGWRTLAARLGVSEQAAQRKYGTTAAKQPRAGGSGCAGRSIRPRVPDRWSFGSLTRSQCPARSVGRLAVRAMTTVAATTVPPATTRNSAGDPHVSRSAPTCATHEPAPSGPNASNDPAFPSEQQRRWEITRCVAWCANACGRSST